MSPTDKQKTITASLIGGSTSDAYNFKWWADSYDVIDMNYTGASAVVTPVAAGSTTIHVSHPKAAYQKDIIIYISQYSEFAFEQKSVELTAGTQSFINIQVPTLNVATKIAYSVKTSTGKDGSSIVSASGTNSVCVLDPHQAGTAIVTANLIAVSSGLSQGTAQLLVNVKAANNSKPYISYPGSTIINIEKGVSQTISASLMGNGATNQDSMSLQWKSSDPSAIRITPSSASGVAVNKEVQITALKAGVQATITISHTKAPDNVVLYCIVPGQDSATIKLDKYQLDLLVSNTVSTIAATITNAQSGDYDNLEWTVMQDKDKPSIKITGSGKTISIVPLAPGKASITATVPSNKAAKATCSITVDDPPGLSLSMSSATVYPGKVFTIQYSVKPDRDKSTIQWRVNDSSLAAQPIDDKNGNLTITTKYGEGVAKITGTTASGAKASISITNRWGNSLMLNKATINSIPVDNHDGVWDVDYTVSPSCAELRVYINGSGMSLKPGTYSNYDAAQGMYTIPASRHSPTGDTSKDSARGRLQFNPTSEYSGIVNIIAWNPDYIDFTGRKNPMEAARANLTIKAAYGALRFKPVIGDRSGSFSRYDTASGMMLIGDGESVDLSFAALEQGAVPQNVTATMTGVNGDISFDPKYDGTYTLSSAVDHYHRDHNNNYTVTEVQNVGTIVISYNNPGNTGTRTFKIPVFYEKRLCHKDKN
jgi:hypothetical protein